VGDIAHDTRLVPTSLYLKIDSKSALRSKERQVKATTWQYKGGLEARLSNAQQSNKTLL
jgi:hypothetical protein